MRPLPSEHMANQVAPRGWENAPRPQAQEMATIQAAVQMYMQGFREGKWKRIRKMVTKFLAQGILAHVFNFVMMVASGGLLGMLGL